MRGERRRRRLAVRARNHDAVLVTNTKARNGLRHRNGSKTSLTRRHRFRVVSSDDVADHHEIGGAIQVRRIVALERLDAPLAQLLAHRRID